MYRPLLGYLGSAAVALAAVLCSATPAAAQRWGGRYGAFGMGYGYGPGWMSPWQGYGFYNNWGYLNSYPGYYNTYTYYPRWRSGWTYYPAYNYAWNTYPGTLYGFQPSNYAAGQVVTSDIQPAQQHTSFYEPDKVYDESNVPKDAALISVRVPPDAKITFSGHETKEQGTFREFVTPSLADNRTYSYEMRAKWTENGQAVDRTREILVHPGDRIHVDFTRDATMVQQMTPADTAQRHESGYGPDINQKLPNDQLKREGETVPAPKDLDKQKRDDQKQDALKQDTQKQDTQKQDTQKPAQTPAAQKPNQAPADKPPQTNPPTAPQSTVK